MAQEWATTTLEEPPAAPCEGTMERSLTRMASLSKLNAEAPEFFPVRSYGQSQSFQKVVMPGLGMAVSAPSPGVGCVHPGAALVPIQNLQRNQYLGQHHHGFKNHYNQFYGVHWEREQGVKVQQLLVELQDHAGGFKNVGISEEIAQKVVNQVEYYFSDLNLATTDHLMRFVNKDPEGYVPLSVVASFKKIKAFTSSHSQLASILRNSTELVVSEDGKRIKRQYPLTEAELEELQSRIVVAEDLPENHSYQNLMKIFSADGSVKTIRTCKTQPNNGSSSLASRSAKADGISNKLHALVEYATIELAEKAVAKLNDEGKWNGLRVKLFSRHMSKSAHSRRRKGHDEEWHKEEESVRHQSHDKASENMGCQSDVLSHEQVVREGAKKGHGRDRGKGSRGNQLLHYHNHHITNDNVTSNGRPSMTKQPPGPRMPDGSRGFAIGRGKPLAT